ncbi:hypothetical protein Bca52824_010958 [Brassica carinata]|uniref:Uncharacterized protein n=1 Tax=Brassica carinata TaxID=52824 RepID=A0A8X7WG56_BRACI|nr:hypothetical protein Bca52824_010958 [Brassica carinata]
MTMVRRRWMLGLFRSAITPETSSRKRVRWRSRGYGLQSSRDRTGRMLRARDRLSVRSRTFSVVLSHTVLHLSYRHPSKDRGLPRKVISAYMSRTSRTTRGCGFRFPG